MSGLGRVAVGVAVVAALASCGGQSSSRSGSNEGGAMSGASGTNASGGSATTGGASGTSPAAAAGGAAPTDGAAGSANGASAGAAGRPVNTDPECADIMREAPCTLEGKECRAVACGADEAFRRDCFCLTNWTCTSCDNPFPTRPGVDIPLCPDDVVDGGECVTDRSVCGPLDNGEYCVCYAGDAGVALVWDCEAPPDPWPE